jgi:hypothetical protein
MLEAYFPNLSYEDGYQKSVRPFLVIVENDTGLPAAAYAITWTARYEDGGVNVVRNMFANRALMLPLVVSYIPPGGVRLISPFFNVTPSQYQSHPNFAQMYPAANYPPADGLASVEPEVDGVVYTDGTFIGPDRTLILQRYVVGRFAERDEALEVLKFIESAMAGPLLAPQLLQMLNQEVQRDNKAYKRTLLARYVRARDRSAQDVERILRDHGLAGLQTRLQALVDASGGSTSPSMFGREYQKLSQSDPRVFGGPPRPWAWGMSWTAAQQ